MKRVISCLAILTLFSFTKISFEDYVWEHYQIGITVPDDCKVVKNTDNEFEMKSKDIDAYMYVFEKNITVEQMDEAVVEAAHNIHMEELDEATTIEGDGLDGFFVEGYKEGHRVVLAGMIDPKSHTNFMLLITFLDKNMKAVDDAVDIIQSVHSLK